MAVPNLIVSPYFSVTCETEGVNYKYSTDGSEPSLVSEDLNSIGKFVIVSGSPMTIKIRAYKDGMKPSDIATCTYTPVTVPMALPDGSVLFYDRGDSYGEYCIGTDGYPVRLDGAEDDGSAESANWRYLICDQHDPDNIGKQWGAYVNEGLTGTTGVGYGLSNTEAMLAKYADNADYWWKLIKERRDSTGLGWFMPSKDELDMLYDNKDVIPSLGGVALQADYYWSSSEYYDTNAWIQGFPYGSQNYYSKSNTSYCRLLRRI